MNQRAYGALLSYASIFINMGIALAFTPFLVSHLGKNEFGLFNIVGSFAAYLIVLDMGMNDSVIRYLLQHKAEGDKKVEKNFLANTFVFYTFLASLVALLGGWLYISMGSLFSNALSSSEIESLKTMTLIIVASAIVTVISNPVGAYITSRQRFVFLTLTTIVLRIMTTIVLVMFLYLGYKAVMVVAVTALMSVGFLVVKIFYAYKNLGMRVKLYDFDMTQIKKLLKYSAPIFIVVLTEIIYWKLDNILLGNMIGAAVVAVYAIGMMFHKYFMSFSTAISKVMMPKIILKLDAGADAFEMEKILTAISRIQAMVIMLILTGIILYGKAFILLWLGSEYIDAYYVMLLTLIPYSLELMGNVRNIFLQVNHLYWYRAIVIFVIAIVNVVITIYAIKMWGMIGAAASTGVAIIVGYSAVNYILWIKLKINIFSYLKNLSKGILPAIMIALVVGALLSRDIIDSWLWLLIHILLYSLLYGLFMRYIAMNDKEKQNTQALKNSILGKFRGGKDAI
jgi:O-antigen/teichoic acid export membrane protein